MIMKIKKQNSSKTQKITIIAISLVTIFSVCAAGIYLYTLNQKAGPTKSQERERDRQYASEKKDFLDKVESEGTQENTNDDSSSSTEPSEDISLNITNSLDQVTVQTNLLNLSSGMCKLAIKGATKSLSKDAPVIYTRDFSTCAGFTVDRSDIDGLDWDITLTVVSGDRTVIKEKSYTLK